MVDIKKQIFQELDNLEEVVQDYLLVVMLLIKLLTVNKKMLTDVFIKYIIIFTNGGYIYGS